MTLTLRIAYERTEEYTAEDWDTACGLAMKEALNGATSVVLTDVDELQYNMWAEPVEDDS